MTGADKQTGVTQSDTGKLMVTVYVGISEGKIAQGEHPCHLEWSVYWLCGRIRHDLLTSWIMPGWLEYEQWSERLTHSEGKEAKPDHIAYKSQGGIFISL